MEDVTESCALLLVAIMLLLFALIVNAETETKAERELYEVQEVANFW